MISILKTTPSSITLQVQEKTIKVFSESFARGFGSPDFIIDTSTIKMWDAPNDDVFVTDGQRQVILQYLLDELSRRNWIVNTERFGDYHICI